MVYRQCKQIQKLTTANFTKIESDAWTRFSKTVTVPRADVQLVQYKNPTLEAVVIVSKGTEQGTYHIFTGNPRYSGHNGYTFVKASGPSGLDLRALIHTHLEVNHGFGNLPTRSANLCGGPQTLVVTVPSDDLVFCGEVLRKETDMEVMEYSSTELLVWYREEARP